MDSIIEKNLFEQKRPRGRPKKEKLSKEQLLSIKDNLMKQMPLLFSAQN